MSTDTKALRPEDFAAMEQRGNLNVGATLLYPQDRYGFVVTQASKSGKVLYMSRLATVDTSTGHEPERFDGPFPVWSHTYTEDEMREMRSPAERIRIQWSEAKQCYRMGGTPVFVGRARYYRNYSY